MSHCRDSCRECPARIVIWLSCSLGQAIAGSSRLVKLVEEENYFAVEGCGSWVALLSHVTIVQQSLNEKFTTNPICVWQAAWAGSVRRTAGIGAQQDDGTLTHPPQVS